MNDTWHYQAFTHRQNIRICTSITWLMPVPAFRSFALFVNTQLKLVFSDRQTPQTVRASLSLGKVCSVWSAWMIPGLTFYIHTDKEPILYRHHLARPSVPSGNLLCIVGTWLTQVLSHRQTPKSVRTSPGLGQFLLSVTSLCTDSPRLIPGTVTQIKPQNCTSSTWPNQINCQYLRSVRTIPGPVQICTQIQSST